MSVESAVERRAFSVVTTFTGPLNDVLDAIKSEMQNYDPRGYGTSVQTLHWTPGGNGELRVVARVSRSKSCD